METVKYYYSKPIFVFKGAFLRIDGEDEVSIPKQKYKEGKRMTMAGIWNEDTGEVRFGLSICHESDKFVKKVGQKLAEKNARENPIMIVSHFSGNFKDYLNLIRHTGHMEERRFYNKYYKNLINGIIND
jgi:hypothetical protein